MTDIKKGDRVRFLQPFVDGAHRHEAGTEIVWEYDYPPSPEVAVLVEPPKPPPVVKAPVTPPPVPKPAVPTMRLPDPPKPRNPEDL